MKGNSQIQLSSRLYLGDIDGDQLDELIEVDGRHLYIFRCNHEHTPLLEHVMPSPVKRLIIGDFVSSGREKGKDQIFTILEDGSIQGWAISDDLTEMWWWFTQANFIKDHEHFIVGDFDGDTADEIMVYDPTTGVIKIHELKNTGLLGEMSGYSLGNLRDHDQKNKLILAGDFGQASNRKDILVIDRAKGQVMRFDTATDSTGTKTFWWAFTSKPNRFGNTEELIVANTTGDLKDNLIVRNLDTGRYRIYQLEYNGGDLIQNNTVDIGQLPVKPHVGRIVAARVRELNLRQEHGATRDDIVYFHEPGREIIRTDARWNAAQSKLTYWFAYSSNIVLEPVRTPERKPWAVMLCRFKGMAGDPAIEKLFREMFTPGSGAIIEYWHDVTLGAVDIAASRVFGWIELDIFRQDAAIGRVALIDAAIRATRKAGFEPVTGFHSQIAVFTHNFTTDQAPAGEDWRNPKWAPYWIDGSSDGLRVSAPPHGHSGTFLAHEMGHGFGFGHDLAADLTTEYGDEYCIMSAANVKAFSHPKWNVSFGPTMSFPQLAIKGWALTRRVQTIVRTWVRDTTPTTFVLTTMSDRKIDGSIGVILPSGESASAWDYYLEYQRPIGWNRGLSSPSLVIRRCSANKGAYLGVVNVPAALGSKASWVEPSGKVKFEVEKIRADNRMIRVSVTKMP